MASGSLPFTYVIPVRPHWWGRVQIIEYAGRLSPDGRTVAPDGGISASFKVAGPLTRTVQPRRFWLMWSAKRYLERLKAEHRG